MSSAPVEFFTLKLIPGEIYHLDTIRDIQITNVSYSNPESLSGKKRTVLRVHYAGSPLEIDDDDEDDEEFDEDDIAEIIDDEDDEDDEEDDEEIIVIPSKKRSASDLDADSSLVDESKLSRGQRKRLNKKLKNEAARAAAPTVEEEEKVRDLLARYMLANGLLEFED